MGRASSWPSKPSADLARQNQKSPRSTALSNAHGRVYTDREVRHQLRLRAALSTRSPRLHAQTSTSGSYTPLLPQSLPPRPRDALRACVWRWVWCSCLLTVKLSSDFFANARLISAPAPSRTPPPSAKCRATNMPCVPRTARCEMCDRKSNTKIARALFDDCSQHSLRKVFSYRSKCQGDVDVCISAVQNEKCEHAYRLLITHHIENAVAGKHKAAVRPVTTA